MAGDCSERAVAGCLERGAEDCSERAVAGYLERVAVVCREVVEKEATRAESDVSRL